MKNCMRIVVLLGAFLLNMSFLSMSAQAQAAAPSEAPTPKKATEIKDLFNAGEVDKNEPTYINSKSLTLKTEERFFQYAGNVEVKHGDLTLTSDFLDGKYSQQNQIEELVARKKVSITKGEGIKAQCERAIYNAKDQTLTLTENPQLEQNGSTLSADLIRIYLQDNRSVAEGQVRVKVVNVSTDINKVKQQ